MIHLYIYTYISIYEPTQLSSYALIVLFPNKNADRLTTARWRLFPSTRTLSWHDYLYLLAARTSHRLQNEHHQPQTLPDDFPAQLWSGTERALVPLRSMREMMGTEYVLVLNEGQLGEIEDAVRYFQGR